MAQQNSGQSYMRSYRSRWASIGIREDLTKLYNGKLAPAVNSGLPFKSFVPTTECERNKLPEAPVKYKHYKRTKDKLHVAIVGAGCAGLFTAMIFDYLNERVKGLNVTYEIFEAAPEERLGGRLLTKKIGPGDHDYYDVGAMRFPDIKIMARTFDLFEELKMTKYRGNQGGKWEPKPGNLIPYYFKGNNIPSYFNDVQIYGDPGHNNPYQITGVPQDIITGGTPEFWLEKIIKKYKDKFLSAKTDEDTFKAWLALMEVDKYSTRQMMYNPNVESDTDRSDLVSDSIPEKKEKIRAYDYNTVEWIETFSVGTRWYDQAFSETVLEALDFDDAADWWCIEGGTQQVAQKMRDALKNKNIRFEHEVKAISLKTPQDWNTDITVTYKDRSKPDTAPDSITKKDFTAVFNSATLGAMQRMDLKGLHLNYGTKAAIRSLGYGASCKVAIKFSKMWWIEEFGIDKGGVAHTDLPLRVCVYPSYNIHDKDAEGKVAGGVLLCSYTWSQDAERIGSLISSKSPEDESELKNLLVHNLALLHTPQSSTDSYDTEYNRVFKLIHDSYETHHAYDWYKDSNASGAFAYFGPGQFKWMYPCLIRNCGQHIIIGEAASAHHAWIVGALESAVRGVYEFLYYNSGNEFAAEAMGHYDKEDVPSPFGPLPAEYDRPVDIHYMNGSSPNERLPCAMAKLAVFAELMENCVDETVVPPTEEIKATEIKAGA